MSATIPINHSILGYSPNPNTTAPPFVGMSVTMCGAATQGCSSGSVTATGQTGTYLGVTVTNMVESSYHTNFGDSGGPVVSGSALVGIQNAVNPNNLSDSFASPVGDVTSNFVGLTWCFSC